MKRWLAIPALALAACAQPQAPPGGERDRTPPRVTAVSPEPLSVRDSAFPGPVRIEFDERISEELDNVRELEDAVLVSPPVNPVTVHRHRSGLDIEMAGGWPAGYVYRVYVRGVLRDLFGNTRTEPIELVFSTGPPILSTAVGGVVVDRITGEAVEGARVEATRRGDGTTYLAATDTGGFFALRHIPAGAYDVVAFQDRDRDRAPGFHEPTDTTLAGVAVNDTAVVTLALLPGDSTPARLIRAVPRDSAAVTLSFDDYFDPDEPPQGTARLFLLPDSVPAGGGDLIHVHEAEEREQAAAEPVAADTTQAVPEPAPMLRDTAAAAADSLRADTTARDTVPEQPLPSRDVVLITDTILVPDTGYVVEVDGVVNIRGVPDGGGAVAFRVPARDTTAAADSVAADTVPLAPDTLATDTVPAHQDTLPPDTVPALPDTTASDTVPVTPDTVPPDTLPPDTLPRDTVPGANARPGATPSRGEPRLPWWLP